MSPIRVGKRGAGIRGTRSRAARRCASVALGLSAVALLAAAGCKIQQTGRADSLAADESRATSSEVRFAVRVARELRARPDSASAILASHRLTRAGLDSLLYRIAADPELAASYDRGIGLHGAEDVE